MNETLCRGCRDVVDVSIVYPGREHREGRCRRCHRPFPVVIVELELSPREIVAERRARGLSGRAVVHVSADALDVR